MAGAAHAARLAGPRVEAGERANPVAATAPGVLDELPALLQALQIESVRIQASLDVMLGEKRVEP